MQVRISFPFQCHFYREMTYLINDISECKAALKKVMNLLERHPGSERLHEQVAKIRAKWMGK